MVALICALDVEMATAKVMLDEIYESLPQSLTDHNVYTLGKIGNHNTVVVCLPSGVYGKVEAATTVSHMKSSFPNIEFGLMVGIGEGVPGQNSDIRLGDVVVSKPTSTSGGVVQYDYGKPLSNGRFNRTGSLNKPPQVLLKAISQVKSDYMTGKKLPSDILLHTTQKNPKINETFSRPHLDLLFESDYTHENENANCSTCDQNRLVKRSQRTSHDSFAHYGIIASADQVMKDASVRDSIADVHEILCFEMEAAGIMDELPSLVIRGICDYCDSHKNKVWQPYEALTAAAYSKALLSVIPFTESRKRKYEEINHKTSRIEYGIPSIAASHFVGRDDILSKIYSILTRKSPQTFVLQGMGGLGKTQIALRVW